MLIDKKIQGEGNRVYLRQLTSKDATAAYVGWLTDPEVTEFLDTKRATIAEVHDYIERKNESPDALFLGIFLSEHDLHIGTIKLEPIDINAGQSAISIMIGDKRYWGGGFGADAMRLLLSYGFERLRLRQIYLGVNRKNERAVRSYKKLGFTIIPMRAGDISSRVQRLIEPHTDDDIVMVRERT